MAGFGRHWTAGVLPRVEVLETQGSSAAMQGFCEYWYNVRVSADELVNGVACHDDLSPVHAITFDALFVPHKE